ncbi:YdcF family protein [Bacillus salitolerans]|uniref:YdcF family protein n=1 Tax=Bacillus salitolerans TaxID=1437434 RepID=A0ABW4LRB2_9BACI
MNIQKSIKRRIVLFLLLLLFLAFLYTVTVHFLILQKANEVPTDQADIVLILGAKLNGEEMSLSLLYRMEAALNYVSNHPFEKVIVSGGQGKGESITEARAMANYLINKGVSKEKIILEDQSTSTYENLSFSKKWINQHDKVLIVSNDFHLFRANIIANRLEYQNVSTLPAKTPQIVQFKLWTREYIAVIKTLLLDY